MKRNLRLTATKVQSTRVGPGTIGVHTHAEINGSASLTELVSAAAEGDPESWDEIVHRFAKLLWMIARSYRLNEADAAEVVQNTWLLLIQNLERIDQPEALPGWLTTTARREALRVLRRRTCELPLQEQDSQAVDAEATQLDARLLTAERDAHLWMCFSRLSQRDQQLLRLLIACEHSYPGVAAALDLPVGSIGPTRMRALQRLRAILDQATYSFDAGDAHTE